MKRFPKKNFAIRALTRAGAPVQERRRDNVRGSAHVMMLQILCETV